MAIFNFVKQAGSMLQGGLDAAVGTAQEISIEEIQKKIQASGLDAKDLAMKKVDDETVKVYAVVESAKEKEELILLVGNTPGVAKVEDAVKVRGGGDAPAPKFYTVQSGDTLSAIAQSQLGSADRYMEIFEANKSILANPDAIDVGQTLRIP